MNYRLRIIPLLFLFIYILSNGCYTYYTIPATEIPKLNTTYSTTVGTAGTKNGKDHWPEKNESITVLRLSNGRVFSLSGTSPVFITFKDRSKLKFDPPILASIKNGILMIASRNISQKWIDLFEISKVQIRK
jgi:hypothetical protein